MEELTINDKYLARLKGLEEDRKVYLDECVDITDYILPQKGIYTSKGNLPHEKARRFSKIIDPIATDSLELLASGIQGGLSSPSRPWFKIEPMDKSLMKIETVQVWLNFAENQMYSTLAGSNFYSKIHDLYEDQGAFGTAVIFIEPDFERIVRFKLCTPGSYCIDVGDDGVVDTLYRRFPMRARNVSLRWPGAISDEVKELAKNKPYSWVQIVHVIERNYQRDPNKIDSSNMPYSECYFEYAKKDKKLMSGGYLERPFAAGRWKTNDTEVYGIGPGHVALGLVKMLQAIQKSSVKAIHKEVDPPMRIPAGFKDVLNQLPGGINFVAENNPKESVGRLFDMHFDYKGTEHKIERVQEALQRIFKRDLFLLITDRPEMTATEVVERSQEKLIMIGPVIERQIHDVLDPCLERTFNIMNRAGMFPPPPPELGEVPLKLNYISLLAQAQKMIGLQGMRSYLDVATAVAQVNPDSIIKTDWDYYLDEYASALSLPPQLTVEDSILQRERAQLQQMQQMAQEIEMLKTGAEAARNLGAAKTDEDNALTEVLSGA